MWTEVYIKGVTPYAIGQFFKYFAYGHKTSCLILTIKGRKDSQKYVCHPA